MIPERELMRKVSLRLIPFMFLLYIVSYLDRVNVSFASLQMNAALGITSIVVSHDVRELATIADESYLLLDGRIAAAGTPEQLRTSTSPAVQQFMTGGAEGPVAFNYPAPDYFTQLLADSDE